MVVLVTGGARSGKSSFAEKYAARLAERGVYVATSQILDDEMGQRIALHRERRVRTGFAWETVEEPYELCRVLREREDAPVVLVDCLTLWLTNWLLAEEEAEDAERRVLARVDELVRVLESYSGRVVLVTNEVGDGIVPEYRLGRSFRDLAGVMNQRIAAASDSVFLVTAGIPVELKSLAFRWPEEGTESGV